MLYKLPLKNADQNALVDDKVYDYIINNEYMKKIKFLENLRRHSHGYAFFQKNWPQKDGTYKSETIYLHKIIADKFIPKPESPIRLLVRFLNSDPLDCRVKNLEWASLSTIVRNTTKIKNATGYRGVIKHGKKFQAIIYLKRKPIFIGSFESAEEAALAYNKKSLELFGETKSLNKIKKK